MPDQKATRRCGLGAMRLVGHILGRRLDGQDPDPDTLAGADWDEAVRCAALAKVLPALGAALAGPSLQRLPEPAATLLSEAAAANGARNVRLRAELSEIVRLLHGAGLRPVLLKGAIRLIDDLYPSPAWRFLGDLDLLLPDAGAAETACRLLTEAGWGTREYPSGAARPEHHLPPLRRPGGAAALEIHTALFDDPRLASVLAARDVLRDAAAVTVGSITVCIPSREHQLRHVVAHAQLHHRLHAVGRLDLRGLLETRLLLASIGPSSAQDLVHALGRVGHGSAAEAWLLTLQDLMGMPPGIPTTRAGLWAHLMMRRGMLQQNHAWADALGAAAGFYVSTADLVLSETARRGRFLRNVTTADFYRRRYCEVRRLLGTR